MKIGNNEMSIDNKFILKQIETKSIIEALFNNFPDATEDDQQWFFDRVKLLLSFSDSNLQDALDQSIKELHNVNEIMKGL